MTRDQVLIVAGVMAAIAVAALDTTAVGTAMPTIIGQLGGIHVYGWVFSAYLLTATTTVPIFAALADSRGRKPVFLVGLTLFVVGSMLCGLSRSMWQMIAFRAFQGLGAGALQPIAFTIVGDIFEPRQRARMQGVFSSIWGVAAILGPALGGFLTGSVGWRWVFFINLPIGLVSGGLIGAALHESFERHREPLDLAGVFTLTGGVAMLLLAITEGNEIGWGSPLFCGLLVGAGLLLALFARSEARAPRPIFSVRLLRRPIVGAGLAIGSLAGVVLFGLAAYLPPLVQGAHGGTPLAAGMAVGGMSIGWPIGSIVSGRAVLRQGVRPVVLIGTLCLIAGTVLLTQTVRITPVWYAAFAAAVTGLGMGLSSTPILVAIQTAVSWEQRGQATGLVQFSRTIGGAIGTGLLGALLANAVGPRTGDILDPVARRSIPAAELATIRHDLANGLGVIYLILVLAAAGTAILAAWLLPVMRIGETIERPELDRVRGGPRGPAGRGARPASD